MGQTARSGCGRAWYRDTRCIRSRCHTPILHSVHGDSLVQRSAPYPGKRDGLDRVAVFKGPQTATAPRNTNTLSPHYGEKPVKDLCGFGACTACVKPQQRWRFHKDAYITTRRIVRRWSRCHAAYGEIGARFPTTVEPRTAYRTVQRINHTTGRVKTRRVRRRPTLCDQGGLNGGYALVNDGPGFAAQLTHAITQVHAGRCGV